MKNYRRFYAIYSSAAQNNRFKFKKKMEPLMKYGYRKKFKDYLMSGVGGYYAGYKPYKKRIPTINKYRQFKANAGLLALRKVREMQRGIEKKYNLYTVASGAAITAADRDWETTNQR